MSGPSVLEERCALGALRLRSASLEGKKRRWEGGINKNRMRKILNLEVGPAVVPEGWDFRLRHG